MAAIAGKARLQRPTDEHVLRTVIYKAAKSKRSGWIMKCALAIVLLCGVALAADLPEMPAAAKGKVADREFWALTGTAFAAAAADAVTTQHGLARGCYETNWVIGPYPSGAAVWSSSLGFAGAATGAAYLVKRSLPNKTLLRHVWRIPQALTIGTGTRAAIHNSRVGCPIAH